MLNSREQALFLGFRQHLIVEGLRGLAKRLAIWRRHLHTLCLDLLEQRSFALDRELALPRGGFSTSFLERRLDVLWEALERLFRHHYRRRIDEPADKRPIRGNLVEFLRPVIPTAFISDRRAPSRGGRSR